MLSQLHFLKYTFGTLIIIVSFFGCASRNENINNNENSDKSIEAIIDKMEFTRAFIINNKLSASMDPQSVNGFLSVSDLGCYTITEIELQPDSVNEIKSTLSDYDDFKSGIPDTPCICGICPRVLIYVCDFQVKIIAEIYLDPTHDMLIFRDSCYSFHFSAGNNHHDYQKSAISLLTTKLSELPRKNFPE